MKIVGISDIVELNQRISEAGMNYKIHLQDSCGSQTMRVERLNTDENNGREETLRSVLRDFFDARGMKIKFYEGNEYFSVQ